MEVWPITNQIALRRVHLSKGLIERHPMAVGWAVICLSTERLQNGIDYTSYGREGLIVFASFQKAELQVARVRNLLDPYLSQM